MEYNLQNFRVMQDIKSGRLYPLRYLTQDTSGYWNSWENIPVRTSIGKGFPNEWMDSVGKRVMVAYSDVVPDNDKIIIDLKEQDGF